MGEKMKWMGKVKFLRGKTGASVSLVKKSLDEANGDVVQAEKIIKDTRRSRNSGTGNSGRIECYMHHNGYIGAMIDVRCKTDFVANTEEFKQLCKELAQQLAVGLPGDLLSQDWIRDSSKKVADLVNEFVLKVDEDIVIQRTQRWALPKGS